MLRLAQGGVASPITTSMGRLFDAVAALCGLRLQINYEGQAAIELEAASDPRERGVYPLPLVRRDGVTVLDARDTIQAVVADLDAELSPGRLAARFHNTIAAATTAACIEIAVDRGLETVVLAGGTFANRLLLERIAADLRHAGLGVLIPERLPPGDGAISYGQAAIAAARSGA
jgi:hydrogenase maturation protein HypF